jgi:rhodanese-related sulfurtransferase
MEEQKVQIESPKEKKNDFGYLLREIVAIIVLAILLGFTHNAFSSRRIPLIRVAPTKVATADSELFTPVNPSAKSSTPAKAVDDSAKFQKSPVVPQPSRKAPAKADITTKSTPKKKLVYSIITLDQVKRLLDERRGVFLDARNPDEFAEGHIIGSKNIPYQEVDKHFEEMMTIPQDTLVVIYCTGPDCELGRGLADFMGNMEFKHLYLYDEGWEGWQKANMPFEGTKAKQ